MLFCLAPSKETMEVPLQIKHICQIAIFFALVAGILHRLICAAAVMRNAADNQIGTVNHLAVSYLHCTLEMHPSRTLANLHLIIVFM